MNTKGKNLRMIAGSRNGNELGQGEDQDHANIGCCDLCNDVPRQQGHHRHSHRHGKRRTSGDIGRTHRRASRQALFRSSDGSVAPLQAGTSLSLLGQAEWLQFPHFADARRNPQRQHTIAGADTALQSNVRLRSTRSRHVIHLEHVR